MKVTFAAKRTKGPAEKTIRVRTNDKTSPETFLIVRADVREKLGFRPNTLHVGEITEGQVVQRSLELVGEEAAGVKLLSADGGEKFEVAMVEEKGVAGKRMVRFTVSPKPPFTLGKVHGYIEIETSHPEKKNLRLRATGQAVGRIPTRP